jgi:hypothetical protein
MTTSRRGSAAVVDWQGCAKSTPRRRSATVVAEMCKVNAPARVSNSRGSDAQTSWAWRRSATIVAEMRDVQSQRPGAGQQQSGSWQRCANVMAQVSNSRGRGVQSQRPGAGQQQPWQGCANAPAQVNNSRGSDAQTSWRRSPNSSTSRDAPRTILTRDDGAPDTHRAQLTLHRPN